MSYQTQRQKVAEELTGILPFLKNKDFDYRKLVNELMMRTYASDSIVRDVIDKFENNNLLKIIITIPDDKITDWLKVEKEEEKVKAEADNVLKEHLPKDDEVISGERKNG